MGLTARDYKDKYLLNNYTKLYKDKMFDERLIDAIWDGDVETFVRLLNRHNVYETNSKGQTYMDCIYRYHRIPLEKRLSMIRHILECGYDPNTVDDKGHTLYFEYYLKGFEHEIFDLLVEYGLDVDRRDNEGLSAKEYHDKYLFDIGPC